MAERVRWQDLARLTPRETAAELLLPLPWLLLAATLAASPVPWLAVIAVAPFFTAALRLAHDTFHRNLGLTRREGDLLLFALSLLLGGALHAIEYTHLRHHRDCLADGDVEGRMARYGFWAALARSPLYPLLIHTETLRRGSARQRRWVVRELVAVASLQALIGCSGNTALQLLSIALIAANVLVPMIGIWSVHRGCTRDGRAARSSRRRWLLRLSFNMLYHDEHHAYPAVPARCLPLLAARLDAQGLRAAPDVLAPAAVPRLCRRATLFALVIVIVAPGCAPRSADRPRIDVCALIAEPVSAVVSTPLVVAEPPDGTLAGSCLVRDARTQALVQIVVHVHTAAAARQRAASLDRTWQLLLAEARNSYGGPPRELRLRRTRDAASFGFERGGSGQILVRGRGLILEVGGRGLASEQAGTLADRIWHALRRAP
jgi:fatty acid desaturase